MIVSRTFRYASLTMILVLLAACGDATATSKPKDVIEANPVTRAECLAMKTKDEKIACFKTLSEQRQAELETSQNRTKALKAENEKRRDRNEALLKEFEDSVIDED